MNLERIYELAIEAASARVNDLSARRRMKDNSFLKRMHEQAIAELTDLGRGYNQMIIDKYKECIPVKSGNFLSFKINDDDPASEILTILEEAAAIFKSSRRPDIVELMEFERIYELALQAVRDRVDELAFCRSLKDNSFLKRMHEQAIAELTDLGRGYNQMIIDKYKELTKNGNA